MSLHEYSKEAFVAQLTKVLSASVPIRSIEYLRGREVELERIDRALVQPGRHIFIYGDRGVGKSSLAATAAYLYQSPEASPITVSGSMDDSFKSIIANLANQALGRSKLESTKKTQTKSITWRGLTWSTGKEVSSLEIANQISTVGDAVELLKQVAKQHSEKPIVVIDEFDAIAEESERVKFASLIKQLGDQDVNLKFIFTGIAKSLDELLGAHASAFRQLETVELPRLGWEARREIVQRATDAFGISVDDNVNWRIAMLCDGFPYYVHIITEKMLWEAFYDSVTVTEVSFDHYFEGLRAAIQSINAELKKPYELAVLNRDSEFESVVWSTADGDDLQRGLKAMYYSYEVIHRKFPPEVPKLSQAKFTELLRKLKQPSFGSILLSIDKRKGWYTYKEKMLRGYVRMQAEANGITLTGERPAPRQTMHTPANARTGFKGSSPPPGVRLNKSYDE